MSKQWIYYCWTYPGQAETEFRPWDCGAFKRDAIREAELAFEKPWSALRRDGFRIRKVKIVAAD